GPAIQSYIKGAKSLAAEQSSRLFELNVRKHQDRNDALLARTGTENPYLLHRELGDVMTRNCTVVRYNKELKETLDKLDEIYERYQHCALSDTSNWTNQNLSFTRALEDMIILARVIAQGALQRDECRGAHYKPE